MSSKADLKLDWCSYQAAKYAVEHWHYSRCLQSGKSVRIGAWERGRFIGCVIFTMGSTNNLGKRFGLTVTQTCELARVAMSSHGVPVSRVVALSIAMLRKRCPGLRLIISFADPEHGHVGAIYQAGNWLYLGKSQPDRYYIDKSGKRWHSRVASSTGVKTQFGIAKRVPRIKDCTIVRTAGKHRYAMPLDAETRLRLIPLAKPYPKRATSETIDTSGYQSEEGGAAPTVALQIEKVDKAVAA